MWLEIASPTYLSEGTRIQGSVTLFSAATIQGVVEGNILQQSVEVLQVGRTGWVHGSVESLGPLLIEGRVEGDITCRAGVKVSASAVISGKILAPTVEIAVGAQINGEFRISGTGASAPAPEIDSHG